MTTNERITGLLKELLAVENLEMLNRNWLTTEPARTKQKIETIEHILKLMKQEAQ